VKKNVDEQTRLLVHVKYAAAAVGECVHQLHAAVDHARSAGASWAQIGEAMEISEQQATEEFGDAERAESRGSAASTQP
jgi:hypothetical protein